MSGKVIVFGKTALIERSSVKDPRRLKFNSVMPKDRALEIRHTVALGIRNAAKGAKNAGRTEQLDVLKKLAELRDAGVVTEDEFREEKDRLLGQS